MTGLVDDSGLMDSRFSYRFNVPSDGCFIVRFGHSNKNTSAVLKSDFTTPITYDTGLPVVLEHDEASIDTRHAVEKFETVQMTCVNKNGTRDAICKHRLVASELNNGQYCGPISCIQLLHRHHPHHSARSQ